NERAINNRQIERQKRRGKSGRGQFASVGFLHHYDARILTQFPRKLTVTHIHGIYFGGSMLEEAVREPTGGSAQVRGGQACYFDLKMPQSMFQFQAAATDVLLVARKSQAVGLA